MDLSCFHGSQVHGGRWPCGDYRALHRSTVPDSLYTGSHLDVVWLHDLKRQRSCRELQPEDRKGNPHTKSGSNHDFWTIQDHEIDLWTQSHPSPFFHSFVHEGTQGLEIVFVYRDDIFFASHPEQQQPENPRAHFSCFNKCDLTITSSRCWLGKQSVTHFEHMVSGSEKIPLTNNFTANTATQSLVRIYNYGRLATGLTSFISSSPLAQEPLLPQGLVRKS